MMRKPILAAATAALLLSSPAGAQQATVDQNLDCAIWASFRLGVSQDEAERTGLMIATAWFIGLYEGQSGRKIGEVMGARAMALSPQEVQALESSCLPRFQDFGNRMTKLGSDLKASGG